MNKVSEDEHSKATGLDEKQATLLDELSTPEGERTFTGRIERIVLKLRGVIGEGRSGPRVRKGIEDAMHDMKQVVDDIGKNHPKASFIKNAREQYAALIKAIENRKKRKQKEGRDEKDQEGQI